MTVSQKPPLKILLIEDSPTDALLFQENLESIVDVSFDLHHCEMLASGLEKLSQDDFDAVVLDLNLPDSAGLATFESLRLEQPNLPVVILTGDDRTAPNEALLKGADNYLLKNTADGNRIAISILSAIRNHSSGINSFNRLPTMKEPKHSG